MVLVSTRAALAAAGLAILSVASGAQSVFRISGEGGRQTLSSLQPLWVSSDGRHVLCRGLDGLFAGDSDGFYDATWYDLWTGVHQPAFTAAGGANPDEDTYMCGPSVNERYLVISTRASNLLPGDSNGLIDVYLLDRQTSVVVRASFTSTGTEPASDCLGRSVSDDGRLVVFETEDGLVPADGNFLFDVYVRDLAANTTQLISVTPGGTSGDLDSVDGSVSADGRFVVFSSGATDLVANDTNNCQDVFLRDLQLGTTVRLSVTAGGVEGDLDSYDASMTPDARFFAFASQATNLAPGVNGPGSIYLLDRTSGKISNVSCSSTGQVSDGICDTPALSADARFVTFMSMATNLDPLDTDGGQQDSFLRDLQTGITRVVTRATNGNQGTPPSHGIHITSLSLPFPDGTRVVFNANLSGLVAGDTNDEFDTFLWDSSSTCPAITSYCSGKLNSQGCVPSITSSGEPRLGPPTDAFYLSATGWIGNQPGIFLWSVQSASAPFFGGTLCVGGSVHRTVPQKSGGLPSGCTGTFSYHFTSAYMTSQGLPAGQLVFGQFWGRDNGIALPNDVGLSDAIQFTVCP